MKADPSRQRSDVQTRLAMRAGEACVHLYPSPLTHESRMARICDAMEKLGAFKSILWVGVGREDLPERERLTSIQERLRIARPGERIPGLLGRVCKTLGWTWRTYRHLRGQAVSCINAHSLPVLPLAVALRWRHRARLIYDTHELETETTASKGVRRPLLRWLERTLIRYADGVGVVSPGIAEWYRNAYGLEDVLVARNIPKRGPGGGTVARTDRLRESFGIGPAELVFLYQGVLGPGRRIEQLLRVFASVPLDRHVIFMGYGPWEERVWDAAKNRSNIHHLSAVGPEHVLEHTAGADVGLCGVENTCLSYYLSLPNKLFEFLAAGVPPIVPDYPEMRKVVLSHRCGWVVGEDDEDWRRLVSGLDSNTLAGVRAEAARAATEFVWEKDEADLLAWYRRRFSYPKMAVRPRATERERRSD